MSARDVSSDVLHASIVISSRPLALTSVESCKLHAATLVSVEPLLACTVRTMGMSKFTARGAAEGGTERR